MPYQLSDGEKYDFYVGEYITPNGSKSRITREVIFRCPTDLAPAVRVRQLIKEKKLDTPPDEIRTATGMEVSGWFKRHPELMSSGGTDTRFTEKSKR